ncbi:branched-chain amino acid transport system ATP-binding protein [Caldalkalibacillus uzonensis]|uniref:Branched-chain amino acid transport system ATP-binding protein n=1 Tax=Caldalkalibacillus uzonensis TaxID=353224 RepID=A0ABU0CP02_9BACI|nr:ABC transporter ATP-binding protein [Caldalkalibacillus uzonensis]MDQ0338140.1 branched-chain amino acid transport system ATP-binding protein [Caldalkalibacillus uzonensis]
MLKVEALTAAYDGVQVLWDVSLEVEEGGIVALIGGNGAGKSTTLKSICGLLQEKKGEISFRGESIMKAEAHHIVEQGIAYVPEGRRVFPEMSVYENLLMGGYNKRARQNIQKNIDHIFEIFPRLYERKNQMAGTLSGGERQMLAIGRGLMSEPELLLLDEPSLGIAPILVQEIFEKIKEINGQGVTILLVEQQVHKALQLASRAFVLEHGRIVISGESRELLNSEEIRNAYLGI